MCTTVTSTNCATICVSVEQRCNQKLQCILRVNFAFIYLRFKIFMCAIHQIGYAKFSGVKYVLFVCKMHLHFSYFPFLFRSLQKHLAFGIGSIHSKLHLNIFRLSLFELRLSRWCFCVCVNTTQFRRNCCSLCARCVSDESMGSISMLLHFHSIILFHILLDSYRDRPDTWFHFAREKRGHTRTNSFTHSYRIRCPYSHVAHTYMFSGLEILEESKLY